MNMIKNRLFMVDNKALSVLAMLAVMSLRVFAGDITVTTDKRFARGATMAFGRMTVTGSDIRETGFCWAETPEPTVDDNKTVKYLSKMERYIGCRTLILPHYIICVRMPLAMMVLRIMAK